ncbi:DUF6332 family protein [Streptomyces sp. NBC_01341]|uniref:DUF6332 family protein n=1 Tax=Streptomyces sp. NBC_01341 TaxID=2903831 RepID=UPI002E0E419C|nr:DUF6332 family protein [Streptomyces sp. NBC_01341]
MQHRTQAQRDAATIETGYALVSGAFVAVATFIGVSLPALLLELPDTGERLLFLSGAVLGAPAFVVRVVHVLLRFQQRPGPRGEQPVQSSQPGRTSPDS